MQNVKRRALVASAAALVASSARAQGDAWPSRPLRLVVPWPAGGPADLIARPIAQRLQDALGKPVVVDNRPGANGEIGVNHVILSPNDGYTLLLGHVGPVCISPATNPHLPYRPLNDLTPVARVVSAPLVMVARPGLNISTMPQLIALAKSRPDGLVFGSVGVGSTTHLAAEMLKRAADIPLLHVPYAGAPPVVTDMLAGRVDLSCLNVSGVQSFIQDGKLIAIATTTAQRPRTFPNLPTVAETVPGFEVNSWHGILGPAGLSPAIVQRLWTEIAAIMAQAELRDALLRQGLEPEATGPADFAAIMRQDTQRWAEAVRAANLTRE
ncbi:Bug family tripartite tricarboxylate transporter substrate binding protein [Humitalea sp. 24SJ18S-53]|uniref:Bug family tripartite tricarboxylate transporter substrate binding protein n=1 Tax=Humitalea sp. 24SJ18S-53 TaxID=3422307 RepID=UPI003D673D7A